MHRYGAAPYFNGTCHTVIIVSEIWEPFQLALALDIRGNMLPY